MLQAQARTGAQSVYAPDLVAQPWQHVCKTPAHTCVIERRLPRLRLFPPTQRSTGPRRPKTKTKVEGAGARHRSHGSLQIVTGRCCREQCHRPSRPPRSHEFMRLIRAPGPCMPSPMHARKHQHPHARTQAPARLQARISAGSTCSQPVHGSAQTAPRAHTHTPRPAEAAGNAVAAAAHPPPACGCALHAARPTADARCTPRALHPKLHVSAAGRWRHAQGVGRAQWRQGTAAGHRGTPSHERET